MFGASGHRTTPPGLVTRDTTCGARTIPGSTGTIKCIVDPRRVRAFCLAHFFMFDGEPGRRREPPADHAGRPFSHTDEVSFERLRVNHYVTKSEEEFRRKLARGRADNGIPSGTASARLSWPGWRACTTMSRTARSRCTCPRCARSWRVESPPARSGILPGARGADDLEEVVDARELEELVDVRRACDHLEPLSPHAGVHLRDEHRGQARSSP